MKVKHPNQLKSYFILEKKNLFIVTITGIIYNIGMTAGPYFEGRLAQCLYDIIGKQKVWMDMVSLAITYLAVILLVQFSRTIKRFYVRQFANDTSKNMRQMLYNSIVHMDKRQLEQEQLGNIMTKAIGDVDTCSEGMRKFTTEIFDTGIVLVAYIVMLCIYDVRLALLSGMFVPIAYIIAEKCKGVVTHYNERYKKNSGRMNQTTMDLVGNAMTYRVFGLEEARRQVYEQDLTEYEHSAVKANVWESALQPVYYIIAMCGAVVIFYFGGKNVMGTGWTVWDIGVFTTFFSCFTKMALKASKSAKLFNAMQKASVSWKRIKPMFREYVEDEEQTDRIAVQSLAFREVEIHYPDQPALLSGLNFEAAAGELIGITGEVASGKTAIGKVLIGEADYTGNILINGRELRDYSKEERVRLVTYMGHDPELLSTSIAENILLGKGAEAGQQKGGLSDQEIVEECLKSVCLDQEIQEMPEKEQTLVGNAGIRLSGGQQARLALARCMQHTGDLMVLDDPFSAVDKQTEQQICAELRTRAHTANGGVLLLISHRLSLFPNLDEVLFVQKGTAVFGTHEELMRSNEGYASLVNMQKGEQHA